MLLFSLTNRSAGHRGAEMRACSDSHAVHLLELSTGRKLLSTASFRAISLSQMLTLEPKNRGATVLKLRLMKQLI